MTGRLTSITSAHSVEVTPFNGVTSDNLITGALNATSYIKKKTKVLNIKIFVIENGRLIHIYEYTYEF